VTFRPIVGWITVASRKVQSEDAWKNNFYPVIISDLMYPTLAEVLSNYCGVFLKEMSEEDATVDAQARLRKLVKPGSDELQPTMGAGQA